MGLFLFGTHRISWRARFGCVHGSQVFLGLVRVCVWWRLSDLYPAKLMGGYARFTQDADLRVSWVWWGGGGGGCSVFFFLFPFTLAHSLKCFG